MEVFHRVPILQGAAVYEMVIFSMNLYLYLQEALHNVINSVLGLCLQTADPVF